MATVTATPKPLRSPMRTISLRTIMSHKLRLVLTVLSVVLGTAFIAGSSMFTTSLSNSFSSIISSAFDDIDVVMTPGENQLDGISMSTINELRADPQVRGVGVGTTDSSVIVTGSDGKAIQTGGAASAAFAVDPQEQAMASLPLTEGNYPKNPGEVAITTGAAERGNIKVGDTITVLTQHDRSTMKITGITEFTADTGGWIGVLYPESEYLKKFTDGEHVTQVSISLNDASAADSFRETLAARYPDSTVETGQALVDQTNKQIKQMLSFVNYFLWAFAGIALLVGTFIISNTFSMIVAQRNREFALLRSIGVKQAQITRSVVFEAIVVGIVGSLLGILAGFGIVKAIYAVMNARGFGLPSSGTALTIQTILAPLIVGVIVTVISAWAPARRAGAVRPVQAMRSGDQSSSNSLLIRTIFGAAVGALGLVLVVVPTFLSSGGVGVKSSLIGVGALLLVVGLWLAGPTLSIPLVGGLGRIIGAPFGMVGKLAATNSRRNPRRTAATSFALTLGLMMVSSIGMLGATMRESTAEIVDNSVAANFVLTGPSDSTLTIPKDAPARIAEVDGVDSTVTTYRAPILLNERAIDGANRQGPIVSVIEGDYNSAYETRLLEGSVDTAASDGIVLSENVSKQLGLSVGDTLELSEFSIEATQKAQQNGDFSAVVGKPEKTTVKVQAIYADDSSELRAFLPMPTAERVVTQDKINVDKVFVKTDSGANQSTVRDNLNNAVADDLVVSVLSKSEYAGKATQGITQMLSLLYGLLGLAVIIAILGIINTLALSVVERRQEIGMLRAVGTLRGQIRRMIYIESAVIALFGALLGAAIGLGVGWAFISVLSDSGLDKATVPWAQVAIMLVASGFVGVLAAVWPGHKAARTKPLEAITT